MTTLQSEFTTQVSAIWRTYSLSKLMKNVHAELQDYQVNGCLFTATVINSDSPDNLNNPDSSYSPDKKQPNCFVISPYANLINYATDELDKLPKLARYCSLVLITIFAKLLEKSNIDKVQVLANGLMATNVVSQSFINIPMDELIHATTGRLPEHTLIIRSLNERQHADYIDKLKSSGWLAVVNRQIYIIDDWEHTHKRRDFKRDMKLLNDESYQFEQLTTQSCFNKFEVAEKLYNQLYLDKYTRENVQFTALYMQQMVQSDILCLHLLFDNQLDKYVGMVATIRHENTMIVPMVGYDIDLPQQKNLYRRLMIFAINQARLTNQALVSGTGMDGLTLHLSAGAPQFKRHRGAEATIEYMMVYVAHLPKEQRRQKAIWHTLSALSRKYYAPLLQKLEL